VRVSFVLSLFSFTPNAVYVHSPVIPCTYLLLVPDEAFTVLFVQLCFSTVRRFNRINHVLFHGLSGPDLSDGPRHCCSLCEECVVEPVLSLDPLPTSTQSKPSWIHLLFHIQPFLSLYLHPLFQQFAFAFPWSQPSSS
jgi:hypothetical protein